MDGDNPLDRSAVHPEAYPLVERILAKLQKDVRDVMGRSDVLRQVAPKEFTDERFGLPTVQDVLGELEKPGRDPRPEFRSAQFRDGVETLKDLQPGMLLEGVVTNVANFGAFVDIGVHQDGLVHVSALSNRFVKDPREVVKTGQLVKVKVVDVDLPRSRIALTMRLDDPVGERSSDQAEQGPRGARPDRAPRRDERAGSRPPGREAGSRPGKAGPQQFDGAMAAAFAKLRGGR
jgi:uncharacterized protein